MGDGSVWGVEVGMEEMMDMLGEVGGEMERGGRYGSGGVCTEGGGCGMCNGSGGRCEGSVGVYMEESWWV